MKLFNLFRKTTWVKCGMFNCNEVFQIWDRGAAPVIFTCPKCEEKMNLGIVQYLHAHTGKLKGNFHLIDGYKA